MSTKSEPDTQPQQPSNPKLYQQAIEKGQEALEATNSKAQAAREIFNMLCDEPRDVVLQAFIDGATITPKGAPTYFYNVKKKLRREQRAAANST